MLEDLTVKDFALIDSVSLEFSRGFSILTGETGAGKSILIGSLTFLLGGKASMDLIRTGADEARVSGTIFLEPNARSAREWLSDHGIQPENDRVLLRRALRTNGKSASWIEDTPITRAELVEFTSLLVDIHGQHEHQSLLRIEEHRRFLDAFAGIEDEVRAFTAYYSELAAKRKLRDEMSTSEKERAEKAELLRFAIDEITAAKLSPSEEDDLSAEEQRLSQHEKLFAVLEQLTESLSASDGSVPKLNRARSHLETISSIDPSLSPLLSRLESAYYELDDIADSLRQYHAGLAFDPSRLEFIQERLSVIYKLKKKYGATVPDVITYVESAETQLVQLESWESNRKQVEQEIADLERTVYRAGTLLSEKRRQASESLEKQVEEILGSLGMVSTRFRVQITLREGTDTMQKSGPYGFDTIEFMISPNAGEPLRPLVKIASGGELSRVMLALKTVLSAADEAGTLIFDEIDTGIGGEVALSVGAHLKALSAEKQIICITHLASIAVRADNQIKIEKTVQSGKTVTRAFPVSGTGRVEEIARMLAGDGMSAASVQHAEELLSRYAV
ncbi:MAG TPA: DNA repair protein RecN [Treponemataceae bacterium]|jgi:DNA repair protein RecN (Recombination protein N)|nr:DNA repair protein RecN [Treponemataceae bacterium]HOU38691.1 DNA repair protein RecN [Treponemataceae bacterium]HQF72575.1 DNA repair protein RecN [Treponemataceae bacterium]